MGQYMFDAREGTLTRNPVYKRPTANGAYPRHLAFHPNGRFVYLANEDSTLTTFALNSSTGQLKHLQTESTLPARF